ncbi:hypothetical protein [Streptomyces aureus]|uniref:hypothetical protein n=1 Tax=Streptomyces aureus TaxID=193461 RepID=UPI000D14D4EE|nr:hypothetical protein [Streptomyces aureus]
MTLDQALVDAAIARLDRRWTPDEPGGAAAVHLDDGRILTGAGLDHLDAGVTLCPRPSGARDPTTRPLDSSPRGPWSTAG